MVFLLGRNPGAKSIHSVGLCNSSASVFLVRFFLLSTTGTVVGAAGVGGVGVAATSFVFFFFLAMAFCLGAGPRGFRRGTLRDIHCRNSRATGLARASLVPGGRCSDVKRAASVAARRAIFRDLGVSRSRAR